MLYTIALETDSNTSIIDHNQSMYIVCQSLYVVDKKNEILSRQLLEYAPDEVISVIIALMLFVILPNVSVNYT